jgi:hypothetical protein
MLSSLLVRLSRVVQGEMQDQLIGYELAFTSGSPLEESLQITLIPPDSSSAPASFPLSLEFPTEIFGGSSIRILVIGNIGKPRNPEISGRANAYWFIGLKGR